MKYHVSHKDSETIAQGSPRHAQAARSRVIAINVIPSYTEYIFYGMMLNTIIAPSFLALPFLGAGMLAALAVFCIVRLGSRSIAVYKPIMLPIAFAISFVFIQMTFHGESLMANREYVTWILGLIIVQSLSLNKGFFHRFAFATFGIGILLLRYLNMDYNGYVLERAGLDSAVGYSNPNELAAWFGFCCVYFIVIAIETKRNFIRIVSSLFAAGCLFSVGLTVSRVALLAIVIATIIALRQVLKRGFFPILLFAAIGSVIFFSGIFDTAVGLYAQRGTEETGRFLVWPLAIGEFLNSPLIGVGLANMGTYVPSKREFLQPHNSFIYYALASGVIPFFFFMATWIRAARGAFRSKLKGVPIAPFLLPTLIYNVIINLSTDGAFMYAWAIVSLSAALTAGDYALHRIILDQVPSGQSLLNTKRPTTGRFIRRNYQYHDGSPTL